MYLGNETTNSECAIHSAVRGIPSDVQVSVNLAFDNVVIASSKGAVHTHVQGFPVTDKSCHIHTICGVALVPIVLSEGRELETDADTKPLEIEEDRETSFALVHGNSMGDVYAQRLCLPPFAKCNRSTRISAQAPVQMRCVDTRNKRVGA
jgi:hypothetical protein